jgi:hypothetical protein
MAHSNYVWCHGTSPSMYATASHSTIEELIHENDTWTITKLHYLPSGANIAAAMIKGTAVAVYNGSFKEQFGTAGFVFQDWNSKQDGAIGAHVTPGYPSEINPYRSKLGGILTLVVVAEAIAIFHQGDDGTRMRL